MIKVNLIPEEERRRARRVRFRRPTISIPGLDMVLSIIFLLAAVVALFFFNRTATNRINKLENQITEAQKELKELNKEKEMVENIQKRQKELSRWVSLVQNLNKGRSLPVHIMSDINRLKPDYMWFISFEEEGSNFRLSGKTFSNLIISNFMVNMRESKFFSDLQLKEVNEKTEQDQVIMGFTITGKMHSEDGG